MRFLKWALFFAVSFFISLVVVLTLTQEPFKAAVPVRIIFHTTREIPIYYFIAAAFFIGLGLGLIAAAYTFFTQKAHVIEKGKQIRLLEDQVAQLTIGCEGDGAETARDAGEERLPDGRPVSSAPKAPSATDDDDE